jgi:hypothetical protein
MSYCKVNGCRFPSSHLTRSHRCGTCQHYGNGQRECGNPQMIENLKIISQNIIFPKHLKCTSPCCPSPYFHSSDAHTCSYCEGQFGPQCDDRPKLNKFCKGFIDITTNQMYQTQ